MLVVGWAKKKGTDLAPENESKWPDEYCQADEDRKNFDLPAGGAHNFVAVWQSVFPAPEVPPKE